jgi:uncharacterized Fe-S center protein
MAKVYFKQVASYSKTDEVNKAARDVLEKVVEEENIDLNSRVPFKVHFGEKGNITFIAAKNYNGMIGYLKEKGKDSCFIETNALYSGDRMTATQHKALAKDHGFVQLEVIIADGEKGEAYTEVEIHKKHFKSCKIGKAIAEEKQLIIASHFKGHMLAGFGGAIKQLGMGCASRPGKLDQHANSKPHLDVSKCKKCLSCVSHCPQEAIEIGDTSKVDADKCIGCAMCIAACPHEAMTINWFSTKPEVFREKLAEYAFAAQKGKNNIYVSFALNMTDECDCFGVEMKPIVSDLGVFASTDPVAIDKACFDMLNKREGKKIFGGDDIFGYSEEIKLGTTKYELIKI